MTVADKTQLIFGLSGVVVGAALSLLTTWWTDRRRLKRLEKERTEHGKQLLVAILTEIETGMERSNKLAEMAKRGKGSFSRVYVGFWDSLRNQIPLYAFEAEVLKLLHSIYYRFDLINFNMNQGNYGAGGGMARDHLDKLLEETRQLKEIVSKKYGI